MKSLSPHNMGMRVPLLCLLIGFSISSHAETDWASLTMDNDLFVGNDNGYTNGLYVSFFDVGDNESQIPNHDLWVDPLMWSMPENGRKGGVNAYMIGQTMSTPSDINIVVPDENELPYSALLAFTNSYVAVTPMYADRVSTTIGIVGPAALGKETQKFVHKIIGADASVVETANLRLRGCVELRLWLECRHLHPVAVCDDVVAFTPDARGGGLRTCVKEFLACFVVSSYRGDDRGDSACAHGCLVYCWYRWLTN